MRILVCGGRDYEDKETLFQVLDDVALRVTKLEVIAGAARGADRLAAEWARARGVPITEYPADWQTHRRGAEPIRDQQMLDEGRPEAVVAFPGGAGTADMLNRARKAGLTIWKPKRAWSK